MNGNVNFWRNNPQMMKQFMNTIGNGLSNNNNGPTGMNQQIQQQFVENYPVQQTPQQINPVNHIEQNMAERKPSESKSYIYANGYPVLYNNVLPLPVAPPPPPAVAIAVPVPPPVPVVPVGAFPIQQPVISSQGDVIIENTIGGIPFDCRGRPTGHWRDTRFCDIFHACVHGYQRKTYACPIVGERTYFDEITKKCEFVSRNPAGCAVNVFLK